MNCPSCAQTLDASQLVCPQCGDSPEYGVGFDPEADVRESPWAYPGESPEDAGESAASLIDGTEPTIDVPLTSETTAELPAVGFGDPSQYLAATHQPKVRQYLPVSPITPGSIHLPAVPPKKRRRALPVLLLAVALLVTGGGAAAAGYYLGWFGRGTQPSDLMPAATAAYLQVDLDPSLSQKSQAWAFLRDLPEVKKAVAGGGADPKRMIWDAIVASGVDWASGTSYDTDIKPWLGDRIGFGLLGHHDTSAWVTVIQVRDEAAATAKLRSWISSNSQDYDVTTRDGYALISAHADTDFVLGELEQGTLAGNQAFRSDLAALGDTGVLAGWADLAALAKLGSSDPGASTAQGRVATALRFTTDTLALDGRFFAVGGTAIDTSGAGIIGDLPESTGAAVTISGGAEALPLAWPSLSEMGTFGLKKADLEALLGRNITVAVPATTLGAATSAFSSEAPTLGIRITSDDVVRARRALHKLPLDSMQVVDQVDGDVLTAATSRGYLKELTQPAATLSGYGPFSKAVPDHARATSAVYVNLAALRSADADYGEYGDFVTSLQSLGAEVVPDGAGGGSWSVRLVRS